MDERAKNSDLELTSFVTFRLARTQNKLNAQATQILKSQSDLSLVEWRILQLVRMFDGASMSKIAAEVQMDKGQLSRKITVMLGKGLIHTKHDQRDSRKQHLHLTSKAVQLCDHLTPIMQRRQALLVKGIRASDLETFYAVLGRIDQASEKRDID